MADNGTLGKAKGAKKDEFYTQYEDIQREINAYLEYNPDTFRNKTVLLPCDDPEWSNFTRFFAQNFENLGLKKLISTSYAAASKASNYNQKVEIYHQVTIFELNSLQYDENKTDYQGKIFVLDRDTKHLGTIDIDDLEWSYLEGDGDFRSQEVIKLCDEADIIVTNPPFSMFREFVSWITEKNKQFIIIGNQNAIKYREIFPRFKNNEIWLGKGFNGNVGFFISDYSDYAVSSTHKEGLIRVSGVMWFTNIDHGRRHQPLKLMTAEDNKKFSKHKDIRNNGYRHFDNYDAIEVAYTDAIPSDYDGIMGVPITFMDKYCPEQFELIGRTGNIEWAEKECDFYNPPGLEKQKEYREYNKTWRVQNGYLLENGLPVTLYDRFFIRYTDDWKATHSEDFAKGATI